MRKFKFGSNRKARTPKNVYNISLKFLQSQKSQMNVVEEIGMRDFCTMHVFRKSRRIRAN